MMYMYMYIMYIYVCVCIYTHTHTHSHTSSHNWHVERAAFKSLTEGVSEPLRTAQITPKASESFGVIVWHRNDGIFCTLFFYLGTFPNNQDV